MGTLLKRGSRILNHLLPLIAAVLLAGCASTSQRRVVLTGDLLVDGPNAIRNGPAQDQVLWQYRTATAAMRQGRFDQASRLLEDALARVEGNLGPDKSARQSRRLFGSESKKTFLGEPYERVLAYYYRGILYWMAGEPDNARACFRSGQIIDGDAREKSYASDYALLDYLDGLITAKLSGDGSDSWQRATSHRHGSSLPPYNPQANVMIFVDYGPGPSKYSTGEYGEELRFRHNPSPVRSAMVRIDGQALALNPYDDVFFQASTRGGRVMDHVLGNQAVFKKSTDTIADAAIISGAIMASNSKNQEIGAGILLAGLATKFLAAAANPRADTRTWDNLPLYLSFTALELPPGPHTAVIEFLDETNRPLNRLTKTVQFTVPTGPGDTVLYINDQSLTPQILSSL